MNFKYVVYWVDHGETKTHSMQCANREVAILMITSLLRNFFIDDHRAVALRVRGKNGAMQKNYYADGRVKVWRV